MTSCARIHERATHSNGVPYTGGRSGPTLRFATGGGAAINWLGVNISVSILTFSCHIWSMFKFSAKASPIFDIIHVSTNRIDRIATTSSIQPLGELRNRLKPRWQRRGHLRAAQRYRRPKEKNRAWREARPRPAINACRGKSRGPDKKTNVPNSLQTDEIRSTLLSDN